MSITPKTLDFLVENRFMDSRAWHAEHKEDYVINVVEPLRELCRNLTPYALKIDPLFIVEPKIGKCISRINRDTRFSKDKSLYRSTMWVVFARDWHSYPNLPGLVFEFSPEGFRYGLGYYETPRPLLEAWRSLILENDATFKKAKKAFEAQTLFQMEGAFYKRKKCPEAPEALSFWLERKNIDFLHNSTDFDLLFSDGLAEKVGEDLLLLKPVYDLLVKAAERSR